jgi:PilZ domain-containing protein
MRRRIQVRYGVGVLQYTGYSGNISSNGLMLRALRVFEPGTVLELEVLIDEKSYRVKGKVRWAREGDVRLLQTGRVGMGIRFVAPPAEFLEAVKAMDVAAPRAGVSS